MHPRIKRSLSYTDAEILQALGALKANRGNAERTARIVGIPASTLGDWATGRNRRVEALKHSVAGKATGAAAELEQLRARLSEVERELSELKSWRAEVESRL